MQRIKFRTVDLGRVKGNGAFACPKCGISISPDDETEDVYTILETIMKGENLDRITLRCNRCGSLIQVTGFGLLSKIK